MKKVLLVILSLLFCLSNNVYAEKKIPIPVAGGICYQYIATPDGPPEAEYAKGWVNRYEIIE
jgi:hypothetical protein